MRQVAVVNTTTGEILASAAHLADSFLSRFLGLQGRRHLPKGGGLVLFPTASIHMLFMFICIDAIFVAPNGHVVRVARGLRPWTVGPIVPAALYCVELPEGAAGATEPGHVIDLRSE